MAAFAAGTLVDRQSPEPVEDETRDQITTTLDLVPVEAGDLTRTEERLVTLSNARPSVVSIVGGQITGQITDGWVRAGDGDLLTEVEGRPRVLVSGDFDLYRPVTYGSDGPDVLLLQQFLARATGLTVELDGEYGPETGRAAIAYYESIGYDAPVQAGDRGSAQTAHSAALTELSRATDLVDVLNAELASATAALEASQSQRDAEILRLDTALLAGEIESDEHAELVMGVQAGVVEAEAVFADVSQRHLESMPGLLVDLQGARDEARLSGLALNQIVYPQFEPGEFVVHDSLPTEVRLELDGTTLVGLSLRPESLFVEVTLAESLTTGSTIALVDPVTGTEWTPLVETSPDASEALRLVLPPSVDPALLDDVGDVLVRVTHAVASDVFLGPPNAVRSRADGSTFVLTAEGRQSVASEVEVEVVGLGDQGVAFTSAELRPGALLVIGETRT